MAELNAWQKILVEIKPHVNILTYRTWLRPGYQTSSTNGNLHVRVPNSEFKSFIEDHFHDLIATAIQSLNLSVQNIEYEIEEKPAEVSALHAPPPLKGRTVKAPELPEAAWYGIAKEYREAVHPTTAANDNFHYAGFLIAAGALLGKKVFLHGGGEDIVFPNMYAALVGESNWAHKGTALNLAFKICQIVDRDIHKTLSIDTSQGLILDLKKHSNAAVLVAVLAEMKDLISKANAKGSGSLMPQLCSIYDSPDRVETNPKNNWVELENPPLFSIFAGCSPRWLQGLKEEDIEGGIGNRVMFFGGEPREYIHHPPRPDWTALVKMLSEISSYWKKQEPTEVEFSLDADVLWEKFCRSIVSRRTSDPLIDSLGGRDITHVGKTAMIFAALECQKVIEIQHLKPAIVFGEYLFQSRLQIFKGFGASPWVQEEQALIEIVRKRGRISWQALRHLFDRKMSGEVFERHMKYLTNEDGPLVMSYLGTKRYLCANTDWDFDKEM